MKPTLFGKLFLAIFLGMLATLGAMAFSAQWSFRQGFEDYLQKVEEQRMADLAGRLEQDYGYHGSWDFLRDNPEYWFALLNRASGHGHPPPHHFEPPPEFPFADAGRPPPPHREHPPGPPGELFQHGHLRVLDAERRQLVGPPPGGIEPGSREILHPIAHHGATVGWIGFLPDLFAADRLEAAFIRQNTRAHYAILGLTLGVSLLLSLVLARQLLKPVRRLADGAKILASGRYDIQIPLSGRDELGQLASDFNLLARALQRHEQTRRQWVADTSHELRTPLAILRSEVEALLDGIREPTPERLRSLHAEILGLGKLVDDLHELSIHDLGALNYRMEKLDLAELAVDIAGGFTPRFQANNIQFISPPPSIQIIRISGDAWRLRQLLRNLLENSLRYTDADGTCQLEIHRTDTLAVVDIRDSAPGVADDALERLCERFFRADKSRSRALGGTGLGLAIAKSIVDAHGGRLEARHSPLGGVWMRVELPLPPTP